MINRLDAAEIKTVLTKSLVSLIEVTKCKGHILIFLQVY